MEGCIFCQIAAQTKKANIEREDDLIIAFPDIAPKAPIHILIIPKKHIASVARLESKDESLIGHMVLIASQIAKERGLDKTGYRLIFNTGSDSGQVVDHIHLHLIGGKPLGAMA